MPRIRTVKPEFFRHEALYEAERATGLPLRIAFAGLWTVCDREGRFRWQPRVLKLDVLPFDEVDFAAVLEALAEAGFVVQYTADGNLYGCIPSWHKHQQVNVREQQSTIPEPSEACVEHAAHTTKHVHAHDKSSGEGKGKGREGKGVEHAQVRRGSRFALTQLPDDWRSFCQTERKDLDPDLVFAKFSDYWRGVPGAKGSKLDWPATWRNFVRTERAPPGAKPPDPPKPWHQTASGTEAKGRELGLTPEAFTFPDGRQDWQAFAAAVKR